MCLITLAYRVSSRYTLIVAANRDERHTRASDAADWWAHEPHVLGGRDLSAGGSWLAVDRYGRFAAVTNFREPSAQPAKLSRGMLVKDYLCARQSIAAYSRDLQRDGQRYGAFNVLLFDGTELGYVSNRASAATLTAGVHSLSNGHIGTDWPKVRRAARGIEALLAADDPTEQLFDLLAERAPTDSGERRYTDDLFIVGNEYGTRSSTVVLIGRDGQATFVERSFDPQANCVGERRHSFTIQPDMRASSGAKHSAGDSATP